MTEEDLKNKSRELRKRVLIATTRAGRGHVTSCFSCVELLVALYYLGYIKYDPQRPRWEERDFFYFSKGHADALLYAILSDLGFFSTKEFEQYCMEGSRVGPLLRADIPGVEAVMGSLGCGLGIAVGTAIALKISGMPNRVFCMLGDAECHEGSIWEAAYLAGSKNLDNLTIIIDCNRMGATHFIEQEVGNEPFIQKWESFRFRVKRINGHDFGEIQEAINWAKERETKASVILADTVKGKGVSFIENQPLMHGVAVPKDRLNDAILEIENEVF